MPTVFIHPNKLSRVGVTLRIGPQRHISMIVMERVKMCGKSAHMYTVMYICRQPPFEEIPNLVGSLDKWLHKHNPAYVIV